MRLPRLPIPKPITRAAGSIALKCRKKSPQILFLTGTALLGYSLYRTAKASMHLQEIIDIHKKEIAEVKAIEEENSKLDTPVVSKGDIRINKAAVYIRTIIRGGKLYAIPFLCAGASVGCYMGATKILKGRFASALALYASTRKEKEFLEGRIKDKYGEDELDRLYSSEATIMSEDKDGKVVKEVIKEPVGRYVCTKIFSRQTNPSNYEDDLEANRTYLWIKQCWCNNKLQARGHLFVNEVLDILGFPASEHTQEGQIMGWKYYKDPEEAKKHGASNVVDFGIFNNSIQYSEGRLKDGVVGYGDIKLIFNVDPKPIIADVDLAVR